MRCVLPAPACCCHLAGVPSLHVAPHGCPAAVLCLQAVDMSCWPGLRPLYLSTLQQLGLEHTRGIPALVVRHWLTMQQCTHMERTLNAPRIALLHCPCFNTVCTSSGLTQSTSIADYSFMLIALSPLHTHTRALQDALVPEDASRLVRQLLASLLSSPPSHEVATATRNAIRALSECQPC